MRKRAAEDGMTAAANRFVDGVREFVLKKQFGNFANQGQELSNQGRHLAIEDQEPSNRRRHRAIENQELSNRRRHLAIEDH